MKKFLAKLFKVKTVSNDTVPTLVPIPIPTDSEFHYYIKNDLKVSYRLGVDDRVIIVSNEPNGVSCGTLLRFEEITKAKSLIPIVEEDGGETFMVMGTLIPYEEELYNTLMGLSKDHSAWNYVSPSWVQLSDSTVYRKTEDSIVLKYQK